MYNRPFIKITFGGTIASTNEIWACGFHLINTQDTPSYLPWFNTVGASLDQIGAKVIAFLSNAQSRVPAGAQVDWIKAALIGTDGKYMEDSIEAPLTGVGGSSGGYIPQASLCVTMVSDKWKDPGRYNRLYLPVSNQFVGSDWKATTTQATAVATNFKTMLLEIETLLQAIPATHDTFAGVVSGTGAGSQRLVDSVQVGVLVDTQRRRRNKLAEDYQNVPMARWP